MAKNKQQKPKIGAGALAAFGRQGLKELAQALEAFPDSNIRHIEEQGQIGNPTPGEVKEAREEFKKQMQLKAPSKQAEAENEIEPS